jgi:hypothetical protein
MLTCSARISHCANRTRRCCRGCRARRSAQLCALVVKLAVQWVARSATRASAPFHLSAHHVVTCVRCSAARYGRRRGCFLITLPACRMGLLHNLSAGQIVEQLVEAKRLLAQSGEANTATNIVFMGMGVHSELRAHGRSSCTPI